MPEIEAAADAQEAEIAAMRRSPTVALTGWDRVRDEARALGGDGAPDLYCWLLWVDCCRQRAGLHAMDPAWRRHFRAFYGSGAFEDVGRFGVRAAKSDSVCVALVGEVVLAPRKLEVVGVCPIMSANMREAGDRFTTIKENLGACGFRDISGGKADVGAREFKASGGGNTALVIKLLDAQDHPVEFRVYPAMR